MFYMKIRGNWLWAGLAAIAFATPAMGQVMRDIARVDAEGFRVERTVVDGDGWFSPTLEGPGGEILWHIADPFAIPESVKASDTQNETWIGQNLNSHRLSFLRTNGTGTPVYEYDLTAMQPARAYVACAEDASLAVVALSGPIGQTPPLILRAFNEESGPTPLWTYTFDPDYVTLQYYGIDVSADGSLVVCSAYHATTNTSLVVFVDGETGLELRRLPMTPGASAVELSDDGTRAVLTVAATVQVVDTTTLATLHSFGVSGGGGTARLSGNGRVVAAGGFNYRVFRDTGAGWTEILTGSESGHWLGNGLALSANGDTLFLASYRYLDYLTVTSRVFDLTLGVELTRTSTTGTGAYQDAVQRAEASADGQLFALATWGTQDNVHPEVQVFDRELNVVGEIDMPGSAFGLDFTRDGRFVVAGGKRIHANVTGSGGDAYALALELDPLLRGDVNCDGLINFFDIDAFILALFDPPGYAAAYPACDILSADMDENTLVNFFDIDPFVACLFGTCP